MTDPAERLVNLALLIASSRGGVSASGVREAGIGYPEGQDEQAFLRMFERDKDDLRAAGLAIVVDGGDDAERYRLDSASTPTARVALAPDEAALVRAVGAAFADDPAFPLGDDLLFALAKIAPRSAEGPPATSRLADESPEGQGADAATLAAAVGGRKRVRFEYTGAGGASRARDVEPFGLFFREGRWYLVGRDRDLDEVRVFAVSRMGALAPNTGSRKTPDFDVEPGFDVADFARLPFQYGPTPFEAVLRFSPDHAWRAPRLIEGRGSLEPDPDGSLTWRVQARSVDRLLRWVVENGPGVVLLEPERARARLCAGCSEVAARHG
ncbi:MAG: WYL domain-containing protein [Coriobacteriia bacterium]